MRLLDAVELVLTDALGPLHYGVIARRALETGTWRTRALRPDAVLLAALQADIRKHGRESRFQHVGGDLFALRRWGFPEGKAVATRGTSAGIVSEPIAAPGAASGSASARRTQKPARSYPDAAELVLERHGDRRPMHYRTITARALQSGLIDVYSGSPEATLAARIRAENRRRLRRGEPPRFVLYGRGLIGLAKWTGTALALQIEWHNREMRQRLHRRLRSMDPYAFEGLVAELLVALGFEEVTVTGRTADGGIDVRGTLVVGDVIRTRMAVQAKRWKQNVQAPVVQQVRGSLGAHDQGLIITTSDFSRGAREEAQRGNATPVALMNGEQLVELLVEHDIGVRRLPHYLIELDEE